MLTGNNEQIVIPDLQRPLVGVVTHERFRVEIHREHRRKVSKRVVGKCCCHLVDIPIKGCC